MNRIDKLFLEKEKGILNIYCSAGYPELDSLPEILKALQAAGVDMIEIGIPYSDPIADGPVIQKSNAIALSNGMNISLLFEQLRNCRQYFNLPLILMGYLNPVLQFGIEQFCKCASKVGVDGIILPDLPIREYETLYQKHFEDNGLDFIFLVTPETSEERIRKIDSLSKGFIYGVSSSSTTGGIPVLAKQSEYFEKLQKMDLRNPVLAGFGISDRHSFVESSKYTNGGIIGSAYISALEHSTDKTLTTLEFIRNIRS